MQLSTLKTNSLVIGYHHDPVNYALTLALTARHVEGENLY